MMATYFDDGNKYVVGVVKRGNVIYVAGNPLSFFVRVAAHNNTVQSMAWINEEQDYGISCISPPLASLEEALVVAELWAMNDRTFVVRC